jgi:ATP-dependent exoDNAse (exonuclease V) beta subunit
LLFTDEDQTVDPIAATADAAEFGTLVHRVLARIDFTKLVKTAQSAQAEYIRSIVSSCLDGFDSHTSELITSAAELVDQFLQTDRANQLAKAKVVHRELEFILAWPPEIPILSASGQGAGVESPRRYLQGFIDCLYQDSSGGWHLLDYKSNQVSASGVALAAAQFELQLGVYALAAEQILRQPPVELAVHFLRPGIEHRFVWNDAMRSRIREQVNQAIDTTVMHSML